MTRSRLSTCVSCALFLVAYGSPVRGQTPFAVGNVAEPAAARATRDASAANPWLGAQLGYKFGASDELADNLLVSASVVYEIPLASRPFRLPVITNFAHLVSSPKAETEGEESEDKLKELLLSSSGARAGLYPYRVMHTGDDYKVVLHGEASWKLNAFKNDSDEADYLNQFRLGGGVEVAIGVESDDHKPLTLSVTPIFTAFDKEEYEKVFKEAKSHIGSVEIVGVLPIAARTGVLFEYVRGDINAFRAGMIVAMAPK